MPRFWRTSLVLALVTALVFAWGVSGVGGVAFAQTTTTTTAPSVQLAPNQPNPDRIVVVNGVTMDLGVSTRPVQLTPNGISYSDCASNMTLKFPLVLNNFTGTQLLEVWAGTTDCSMQANRGSSGVLPICWQVRTPMAGIVATTSLSYPVSVRVQDIVGHLNSIPTTTAYVPVGSSACTTAQTVDTATTITVYFVPTDTNGYDISGSVTPNDPIQVDLVGPAPPVITSTKTGGGDTLLVPSWTPNIDPDTIGYDVYIDPIPGQESTSGVGAEPVLVCRDAGGASSSDGGTADSGDATASTTASDATTGDDGTDDASSDATIDDGSVSDEASVTDASAVSSSGDGAPECVLELPGTNNTTGAGGVCASSVLSNSSGFVIDAGVVEVPEEDAETVVDDSGLLGLGVADDASAPTPGGGISNIDPKYLYQPNVSTGITAPSQTASSFNITGLKDGIQYNIAIAAVDALGNVGPLSPLQCGTPEPVNDFWKTYREDGGQAGGGLCALEAVGAPAGSAAAFGGFISLVVASLRRRRRNRR